MENTQKIRVSIIILSWNTAKLLRDCLKSLEFEIFNLKFEIIVVDNGSQDKSAEMVKKEFPAVNLIINKNNLGFSKANNQAAKIAKGEYLFFLNSDTIVKESALEKLIDFLDHNQEVGAVSPLLLNEDGSYQIDPCFLRFPSPLRALVYYNKYLRTLFTKIFPNYLFSVSDYTNVSQVEQIPGAALMIRKNLFKQIDGFDEKFPIYFEDVDLSFQINKAGYKLFVVPDARIIHLGRKSIEPVIKKEGLDKFLFLNFNSLFLFCEKNYSKTKAQLIKWAIFFNLLLGLKLGLLKQLINQ
ncbi:hypothetical protein COT44_04780 [Candidatus Shapirobacteria bacterium CG08_land_8_20_14_0_20_39_18]|uniref:Glycosyltransferase 2-like domain-containing protein n=1 Tax=Candidatus Shapirobacteria bacterium CG08_land_8_20_14_0_20_39_18 TaxID=1974883 RepID=A0A2M6XC62_9BACT|nr:MAG: hypothetical protein COT44_04780 [Candidatus Shapirobacteria bacterium CG08_land_8_20_14_0_20_39_18]PIY65369.1 MAG: hypothetical protein COY91_03070 [Candidatus Shapirobacteria bacterium CG_4_10_14_0_8_um_filter_39_15]PJE68578.1 MAG: hypothetical protein COU94_01210 [Candidatus Shapirobacteria bacterium CG10_big_fil_rev_8_21_14_0_10_38_8]